MVDLPMQYRDKSGELISMPNTTSVRAVAQEIDQILPAWLNDRFAESDGIAVALPKIYDTAWDQLFTLSESERQCEELLTESCQGQDTMGFADNFGIISSDFLFDGPSIDRSDLEWMVKKRGWTQEHVQGAIGASLQMNDIRHRMRGAAGWLICNNDFNQQQQSLRDQWMQLQDDERPPLPLHRSLTANLTKRSTDVGQIYELAEESVSAFQKSLDELCAKWWLRGMLTWDIPLVDGPRWTSAPIDIAIPKNATIVQTPPHFAIRGDDELGRVAAEQHRRAAADLGFNDQSKWQIYANLLLIAFWEYVIDRRYGLRERVRGYETKKRHLLATILDLSDDRIKRHRTTLNQFRRGERHDLEDVR